MSVVKVYKTDTVVQVKQPGIQGSVDVTSPITNSGTSGHAVVGIDQSLLAINPAQVNGTAVITTDARLSDARTPLAHAGTHASAGSDPITISASQVTGTAVVVGDPIVVLVRNATGATLTRGQVVYLSGANGTHVQVSLAQANSEVTSARSFGFVQDDIANNASGYVMTEGYLENVDTSGLTAGQALYLSGTTAGAWTTTKPSAPTHLVYLGVVARVNANNGRILVKVQNGYELEELHNVAIASPTNNQVLTYETSSGLWKNKDNTADGVTSLTVSAPLTGGTITSTGTIGLDQTALSIAPSQVTGTAVITTDSRLSDTRTPSDASVTDAKIATTLSPSKITGTAVITTDSRLSDPRTPLDGSVTSAKIAVAGISPASVTGTAVITTDSRLSDSRTPTAHAASHASAGSDPVTLAQSQVTNLTTDLAAKAALASANAFTVGGHTITAQSAAIVPLTLTAASGQSGNMFTINANGATTRVNAFGELFMSGSRPFIMGATQFANTGMSLSAASATIIPVAIRGAASQSANLQEWQNSAGTIQSSIGSDGTLTVPFFRATSTSATVTGTALQSAVNATADILQLRNSSATVLGGRNALAQIYTGSTAPILTAVGGATTAASGTGTTATITTTSAHNLAVGDLVTVAGVTPTGYNGTYVLTAVTSTTLSYANATTGAQTVAGTVSAPAQASITARSAGTTGQIIKLAASQASNALEVQSSAGSVLTRIESSGQIASGSFLLGTDASGGRLTLVRATSTPANPGANLAKLYFRDGTNAGTLKLVVRAGAAGAETTIFDNIPQ